MRYYLIFLLTMFSYLQAYEFDEFMDVLEETTQIATKNQVGADYAPGIITVLTNEEIERLGAKNFYEAIEFVTGVTVNKTNLGIRNLIIRGLGIPSTGKVKVLINGIEQNIASSGFNVFSLPSSLIERIEIIRGPASALYGEYAFSGVINLVTKQNVNMLSYRSDSVSNLYSAIASYSDEKTSLNALYAYHSEKSAYFKTTDFLGNEQGDSPKSDEKSLLFDMTHNDMSLKVFYNTTDMSQTFGYVMPEMNEYSYYDYGFQNVEFSYDWKVNEALSIRPKIGYLKHAEELDYFLMVSPLIAEQKYEDEKSYAMVDAFYTYQNHMFVAGVEYASTKELKLSNIYDNLLDGTSVDGYEGFALGKRKVLSGYLQDTITLSESLSLNAGIRYDKYDDLNNDVIDGYLSSRLAGVYELNRANIFKLQYSEAFRAPSFRESLPTPLDFEMNKMVEFEHIFKQKNYSIKSILYYSIIDNLLGRTPEGARHNIEKKIKNMGAEVEATLNLNNDFLIKGNFSYSDTDFDGFPPIPNYVDTMANLALSYKPYSKFSSTIWAKYLGNKRMVTPDPNQGPFDETHVNVSFKYLPEFAEDMRVLFGVQNIFNDYHPSVEAGGPYEEGLYVQQRRYFVDVSYNF